jgi:hypothetical protein
MDKFPSYLVSVGSVVLRGSTVRQRARLGGLGRSKGTDIREVFLERWSAEAHPQRALTVCNPNMHLVPLSGCTRVT